MGSPKAQGAQIRGRRTSSRWAAVRARLRGLVRDPIRELIEAAVRIGRAVARRGKAAVARAAGDPPLALLTALLAVAFVIVLARAHLYGISVDEPLQQRYGESVLAWYRSLGKDTSFLTAFAPDDHMPEHGGIFDAGIAALQALFSGVNPSVDPWLVRHIATGLCGWLGIVTIALCGFELGGSWVAFVAALGLWLYPRYYGAIYNNPKDVPAAVALTFVLWATLLLVRRWRCARPPLGTAILLGCCIGVAAAIRVNAVSWYAVLALLLAGWWIANAPRIRLLWQDRQLGQLGADLRRQGMIGAGVVISSAVTMVALWPYLALSPVAHLAEAIQVMRAYPWNGLVLYRGVEYHASALPPDYVPTWLAIGSPPALVALALLGIGLAAAGMLARWPLMRRLESRESGEGSDRNAHPDASPQIPRGTGLDTRRDARRDVRLAPVGVTLLALVVSLLLLVALRPVLYDTLRQFLYVIPPMVLLAAWGLVRAVELLIGWGRRAPGRYARWVALALVLVLVVATVASYAQVAVEMAMLSPFEYTYFSPLVGGLPGAAGHYDTDYWATCSKPAAEWLAAHFRDYAPDLARTSMPTVEGPVIEGTPMQSLIAPYLPSTFHEDDTHPDFVVAVTRDHNDQMYPAYPVIYVVAADGVRLCVVKARPGTA